MKKERSFSSVNRKYGTPGVRTRNTRTGTLETRTPSPRILILCEGKKTEPNYFLAFRVTNEVYGEGLETMRVVEEAVRRNTEDGPFDQVWCVFDRDEFPPDHFDNAISMVMSRTNEGFRVAYSNEAFELWYLLHFEYLDSAVSRTHYIDRLHSLIHRTYKKGDPEIYHLLQRYGDEQLAIRFAQRLREEHDKSKIPYSRRSPETTVDHLVEALRKVLKNRGY